jgi:hypothetical protein
MPGPNLGFDGRDLPAATRYSCRLLPFSGEFLECPAVAVEFGLFAAERLPPLNDYLDVLRFQLDAVADPLSQFCSR